MIIIEWGNRIMEKNKGKEEKVLSIEQKKSTVDLWIIFLITFIVLSAYSTFSSKLIMFVNNEAAPMLIRTFVIAFMQFGVAGLGITVVCILRKQSFFSYGLKKENAVKAILLSCLMYLPQTIFIVASGEWHGYSPFQEVNIRYNVLTSEFPTNLFGMLMIILAWGFFEGFNYVVIMDKLNIRYPSKNKWLDTGAIVCAIMCILIHGAIGVTPKDVVEMFTVFIIIYGMLMVRKFTGNAWGCVFTFLLLWNAY
jgi:hypothetical protein